MLPRKAADLLAHYKTPKQCYEENPGKFLVGVINIKNNKITLYPCIQERVWLEANPETGDFLRGWQQEKGIGGSLIKGKALSTDMKVYNETPYAPRALSFTDNPRNKITSHEYLIQLMGEEKHKADYRGFSVIPGTPPVFAWDSTSLNAPLHLPQFKKLEKRYRDIVVSIVNEWIQPSSSLLVKHSLMSSIAAPSASAYVYLSYEYQRCFIDETMVTALKVLDTLITLEPDKKFKKQNLADIFDDLNTPIVDKSEELFNLNLNKLFLAFRNDFIILSRSYFKKIKTDGDAELNNIQENNRELSQYLTNAQGLLKTANLIFEKLCKKFDKPVGKSLAITTGLEKLFSQPDWEEVSSMLKKALSTKNR